ncbi:hypothetical protein [Chryseobacterium chendengshani]|uniref:hypothetical protein n=1 Tax=Chryseobacterium sp. LJ756 TaxID=2864113 RepID=UPI001C642811|nr:hypothetical protein [Chryseobacterium sp. LJ756]MBW7673980.1 hypothetical protein [Chryseobacterium sp. LJ756]
MKKIILIFLSVFFFIFISCRKENKKKLIDSNQNAEIIQNELATALSKLFNERNPNKYFVVGSWKKQKLESHFRYIGKVTNSKNEIINIVTQTKYEGEISRRAINSIMVWQDENKYIGFYHISIKDDLPNKMENGILYFENVNNNCDKKITTKINFNKEIPQKIFRKCKDGYGDLYEFQIDE